MKKCAGLWGTQALGQEAQNMDRYQKEWTSKVQKNNKDMGTEWKWMREKKEKE